MDWSIIPDFHDYSVSSHGQIRNDNTGRYLALTRNQHGVVQVGLMKGGIQHKRSVTLLVANAFLDPPTPNTFDTPINKDGDRLNNDVHNLVWRPRWFAVLYNKQFEDDKMGFDKPIYDISSLEEFDNSMHAATRYGLLDKDIYQATIERTYVWPTYQQFRVI